MKNKKIIFLLQTLSTGGGERVASELSLGLSDDIKKIIVLFKKEIFYPYKGEIVSLDIPKSPNVFGKAINSFSGLIKFRRLIKKEKPDYVISFGHVPNLVNIFSGAKSVVRVDNFYSLSCWGVGGVIYKFLVRILFNRAFMIMPVSKESADDLVENFKIKRNKIKVIYNPLNIKIIKELSQEPLEKEYESIFKNPVIINIGQLGKQKNQKDLIESFRSIKKEVKDAKLVILGQGAMEGALKELARILGMDRDIYFLGWQKSPFKFLANAKIFVSSSLWEGLPCVLLEAMACGLPIVSYDCKSGPREILAPETNVGDAAKGIEYSKYGVLVEPGNVDLLASAATNILLNEGLHEKLRESSLKRASDFDVVKIIKEWQFLYE